MNVFDIGITMYLTDRVSAGLGALAGQFARTQTAATALQNRMTQIHSVFNRGTMMIAGGIALATPLILAERSAERLEGALKRVQVAGSASNAQMQQFSKQLSSVSNMTGVFSKPTLAAFGANMIESGLDFAQMSKLLEQFAKSADVMKIISHDKITPEQTAHGLAGLAHQFGRYDAQSMRPIVDAVTRLAPHLPGGMNTLLGMGSYANVIGNRTLGIDPVQLMALEATVAQTSGGKGVGRGQLSGSNLANALQRSMPGIFGGGLLEGKSAFMAQVMGLADSKGFSTAFKKDKTGKSVMDLGALLGRYIAVGNEGVTSQGRLALAMRMQAAESHLTKTQLANMKPMIDAIISSRGMKGDPGQLLTTMFKQLGGSAGMMMTLFSDPKFQGQLAKNTKLAGSGQTVDQMQKALSDTTPFQRIRASTNIETLMSSFGQAMLPAMKKVFSYIADVTDKINTFVETHPKISQAVAAIMAAAAGAMVLGGALNWATAGFMGLRLLIVPVGAAMLRLGACIIGLTPAGRAALVAVGALVLVVQHWAQISAWCKSQVYTHIDAIKLALALGIMAVDKFGKAIQRFVGIIGGLIGNLGEILNGMGIQNGLGDAAKSLMKPFESFEKYAKSAQGRMTANMVLGQAAPDLRDALDNFQSETRKAYEAQNKKTAPSAATAAAAIAAAAATKQALFPAAAMAASKAASASAGKGASGGASHGAHGAHGPNVIPIAAAGYGQHKEFVPTHQIQHHHHFENHFHIDGTKDSREHAKKIMSHIEDQARRASAATTQAGGVDVSKHAFGSGR